MAVRKRRPGGGRKPHGKFPKDATFTTRLTSETRRALDEAAKMSGLSVSVTAERILGAGLQRPSGKPHNRALAHAAALLAEKIEDGAQRSWLDDPFTGEAVCYAINALLLYYASKWSDGNTPTLPPAVEEAATKMPTAFAKRFREPAGFGEFLAFNLINEINQATSQNHDEWSLPIFLSPKPAQLALIGRDLGLAESKKGKSK